MFLMYEILYPPLWFLPCRLLLLREGKKNLPLSLANSLENLLFYQDFYQKQINTRKTKDRFNSLISSIFCCFDGLLAQSPHHGLCVEVICMDKYSGDTVRIVLSVPGRQVPCQLSYTEFTDVPISQHTRSADQFSQPMAIQNGSFYLKLG